jgi:hypothetical protein
VRMGHDSERAATLSSEAQRLRLRRTLAWQLQRSEVAVVSPSSPLANGTLMV